ncbi:MAG: glycosyltransferase family 4 protein, partial [Thermoleophilaceae bacterium]
MASRRAIAVSPLATLAGGETNLLRLIPALTPHGWATTITVPGEGRLRRSAEAAGIPVRRLRLGPPERRTPAAYAGAALAVRVLGDCDVALLNGLSTQRVVPALAVLGRPAVLVVNNPVESPPRAWRHARQWTTIRAIAAASHHTAAECRAAGAPPERVHVAYAAAWSDGTPPGASTPPPSGSRVGFVGRIEPRKGVLELIEAARGFLSDRPDATLTIVGDADDPRGDYALRVREAAAAPELHGRVTLAGFREDAAATMADFDLVVVPSLHEPYGTVAAEAAATARATVVSAVGGMTEVVIDGETGL